MFSHIMIGSNDIARSKKFYDALFAALDGQPGTEDARGRLAYSHNGGRFMASKPIDGKPASHANGGTIGFVMKDAAQAEAWHKAGVANGGTSLPSCSLSGGSIANCGEGWRGISVCATARQRCDREVRCKTGAAPASGSQDAGPLQAAWLRPGQTI